MKEVYTGKGMVKEQDEEVSKLEQHDVYGEFVAHSW